MPTAIHAYMKNAKEYGHEDTLFVVCIFKELCPRRERARRGNKSERERNLCVGACACMYVFVLVCMSGGVCRYC